MKQRLLVSSIVMGLYATLSIGSAMAQSADEQSQEKKKDTTELQGVVVTGSLIPRAQIETASPTITITSADMKREGFKNVYDALRALPVATGAVQDSQYTQGFTPGASTISLLGLDPSFTLVLVNGRPLADYPFLYNSQSNFVDLSGIPNMIVDHIDILPGNQSAIYGSAAIAGVINVVLKQKMDGVVLDYRVGGYTDGGGQQQRLQIGGGNSWGKLDVLWALELDNSNPVYFRQREWSDSNADNPALNGATPLPSFDRVMRSAIRRADGNSQLVRPGSVDCGNIANLFRGTMVPFTRTTGANRGPYCGTIYDSANGTMQNESKAANGYLSLKYQFNDSMQGYGDVLYNSTKVSYASGGGFQEFWSTSANIYDRDTGTLTNLLQYVLAPEEVQGANNGNVIGRSYVVNLGVRGNFGSDWNYDAYYHRSQSNQESKRRRFLAAKVKDWFLGPQDGTFNLNGRDFPAYHITQTGHFWNAMTPADYTSLSDAVRSDSETYTQNLNVTLTNTDLFHLPAGSVGFAGVVEVGDQLWDNPVDPRVTAGQFFNLGGTSGHGTRDRQAVAVEFTAPIFSTLTADLAARWDRYKAAGNSQGKVTYKLGLEYRPFESLLLRGNYGTAFRAPDMGYVFSTGSSGFQNGLVDYYTCRKNLKPGEVFDADNCATQSIKYTSNGNKDLKYITAKSFGYGFVWSPTSNLSVRTDYYHIKIANQVASYSTQRILEKEADCRFGQTSGGTVVDSNSPVCKQYLSQVHRLPFDDPFTPGLLQTVDTYPINVATETLSGITLNAAYRWDTGRFGDLTFTADYNTTLTHTYRTFPEDPETDQLRDTGYTNQYKQAFAGTVTWDIGPWSASVRGTRIGKTRRFDGKGLVAPWMIYNGSVQYNFSDDASLSLIGNNIFNSRPPLDHTYTSFPYYNVFYYNGFGRMVMLEMNVHFGGSKK